MAEYATVEDYEARYGTLSESEASRVEALISDASLKVDALVERHGVDAAKKKDVLAAMTCEYVHYKRQFAVGSNVSSVMHQAGSFMESYNMRAEMGFDKWARLYFGDALGISGGAATTAKVAIHDRSGAMPGDLNDW